LPHQQRFRKLTEEWGTVFGYHGSPLENWYSILINGFNVKYSKNGIYGYGIYLAHNNRVGGRE
jgi:hypothetical protein